MCVCVCVCVSMCVHVHVCECVSMSKCAHVCPQHMLKQHSETLHTQLFPPPSPHLLHKPCTHAHGHTCEHVHMDVHMDVHKHRDACTWDTHGGSCSSEESLQAAFPAGVLDSCLVAQVQKLDCLWVRAEMKGGRSGSRERGESARARECVKV